MSSLCLISSFAVILSTVFGCETPALWNQFKANVWKYVEIAQKAFWEKFQSDENTTFVWHFTKMFACLMYFLHGFVCCIVDEVVSACTAAFKLQFWLSYLSFHCYFVYVNVGSFFHPVDLIILRFLYFMVFLIFILQLICCLLTVWNHFVLLNLVSWYALQPLLCQHFGFVCPYGICVKCVSSVRAITTFMAFV